mmetsp:Transcript_88018/g.226951  ORF Transcript_88018/g.226951 Transcript_88018/m.226951 type:complete len:246 (-) Transcript_88018:2267-3004(-)
MCVLEDLAEALMLAAAACPVALRPFAPSADDAVLRLGGHADPLLARCRLSERTLASFATVAGVHLHSAFALSLALPGGAIGPLAPAFKDTRLLAAALLLQALLCHSQGLFARLPALIGVPDDRAGTAAHALAAIGLLPLAPIAVLAVLRQAHILLALGQVGATCVVHLDALAVGVVTVHDADDECFARGLHLGGCQVARLLACGAAAASGRALEVGHPSAPDAVVGRLRGALVALDHLLGGANVA